MGGGQDVTYIDFAVHPHDSGCRAWARRCAVIGSYALGGTPVTSNTRHPHCHA
jgi:hypothetical protein